MKFYSVAIDGPAGAGKSTIARAAAAALGFVYVDTGAIYRTLAVGVERAGVDAGDVRAVAELLPRLAVTLDWPEDGLQHMYLNGEDVTGQIREPKISQLTSRLSALPCVRDFLMETQRRIARSRSVVMDGRDIGTVVLPDAPVKIFLSASPEERAKRRWLELKSKGAEANFQEVYREMYQRDERDQNRSVAPLKPADDAELLDTSSLTLEQSIDAVITIIQRKMKL